MSPKKPNFTIHGSYDYTAKTASRVEVSRLCDPDDYSTRLFSIGKLGASGLLRRG